MVLSIASHRFPTIYQALSGIDKLFLYHILSKINKYGSPESEPELKLMDITCFENWATLLLIYYVRVLTDSYQIWHTPSLVKAN